MIDPYSLKKAKEDEEDKMLKEVRLPIGQVQTDIPLTCLLFKDVSSTLAVSNIRNRTYTNYEVYLIGYGYGKFKEKIHFME